MTLVEDLKYRGLIYGETDPEVEEKLNEGNMTFYFGADPTGDSLHIGHLVGYLLAKRLEKYGHKPIFLIGGATGFIGDPKQSGERKLLTLETINHNAQCLYNQVSRLFNCEMVNNYDWISKISLLDFFRIYGKEFNINYMLNKETVKARIDSGISYTEFSYQILQALDFEHLYREKGVTLQMGGQDQWGNICSGIELIRKLDGADCKVYGLTTPLITKSDGTKFGKSESGAVWLDRNKTSVYEFYQFWINTPDSDVITRLKQFTFLSKEEIEEIEIDFKEHPENRLAQKTLAKEVTIIVHGEDAYLEALHITEALFTGSVNQLTKEELEMAVKGFDELDLKEPTGLINCVTGTKLASSNREAREFISNSAISVNGTKVNDLNFVVSKETALFDKYVVLRRGKKKYGLVVIE